uniref:C2 domain-containing protein n=1 Tax=Cannabis sativa TaxID=3483 RepID=A0A803NXL9_CANSA
MKPSEGGNDHFRTTEIDTQGGSYPKWNEKLVLELPAQSPAVSIEVYCKTVFGNRLVGVARVPVSDFSGGYVPENYLHFLSYRLRDQKGERNGIVNISVRTKVPLPLSIPPTPTEYSSCSASAPLVGVPVGNNSFSGGVVTGIPVWMDFEDKIKNQVNVDSNDESDSSTTKVEEDVGVANTTTVTVVIARYIDQGSSPFG